MDEVGAIEELITDFVDSWRPLGAGLLKDNAEILAQYLADNGCVIVRVDKAKDVQQLEFDWPHDE